MSYYLTKPKSKNIFFRISHSIFFITIFFNLTLVYSQDKSSDINLTPNGYFDEVFDDKGNVYKLSDLAVGKSKIFKNTILSESILLCSPGIFELYFETGSGMEQTGNPLHNQRRAVICQAFQDLSDFLNTPLKNSGNTNKVKIWVRSPTEMGIPSAAAGAASAYYNIPVGVSDNRGGIVDNEVWKTINSGVDSFTNTVFPVINYENTDGFYHGWVTFNFGGTVNWNLDYNKYNAATGYINNSVDFYTTVVHEVVHALGFSSLINYNGSSVFFVINNQVFGAKYYSRYDKFLHTSNSAKLIKNTVSSGGQMYNFSFDPPSTVLYTGCSFVPPTFNGNSGLFNCPSSLKYIGSVTVPVYTSPCFERGSSLSHFEDACHNGNSNDQYFMMSERASGVFAKRFLKEEERLVLCDIGYSVKGVYGNIANFTFKDYETLDCQGIQVAGVNDGFLTSGSFAYQGNSGEEITISGILNNDYTGGLSSNLRYEFVQDVYDPDALFSSTTGNSSASFTFKSYVPGLHLLRYVPYDISTNQRGNITYIYVNVLNNCAVIDPCDLVKNGDFEQFNYSPTGSGQIYKACGWQNASYRPSSDYFNTSSAFVSYNVPCNMYGYQPDRISGNKGYAGMFISPNRPELLQSVYSESIKTELSSTLLPNTNYQLKFDVSLAEAMSQKSIKFQTLITDSNLELATGGIIPTNYITSNTIFLTNPTFSNTSSANASGWETITFNFTTGSNPNLKYLYLGGLNNVQFQNQAVTVQTECPTGVIANSSAQSYYYIDNVSLRQIDVEIQQLEAVNDDFVSMPISSVYGGITQSVFTNDLFGGNPTNGTLISDVQFSLVEPITIAGATINSSGLINIPPGTPEGNYTLTYFIQTDLNCGSSDTATVTIYVRDFVQTPTLSNAIRANNLVRLVEIQNTGKIIIGGFFSKYNNITKNRIARLNTDLTIDETFTSIGANPVNQPPMDIKIQPDNKVLIVGWFNGYSGGSNGYGLARLMPDGALDTSFNAGGVGFHAEIGYSNCKNYSCALQPDGKILIGGDFYYYNGVKRLGIVRLNSNGTLDTSFNPIEINDFYRSVVTEILVQPDGKILIGGIFGSPNHSNSNLVLIRLNSNGTIDNSFSIGNVDGSTYYVNIGSGLYSPIAKLALLSDGKIIAAGGFTKYNNIDVRSIIKLLPNGQLDTSFNVSSGVNRGIHDVLIESQTEKLILAGEFTTFGGVSVKKMIRLFNNGSYDNSFNIGSGTGDSSGLGLAFNNIHVLKKQLDGKIIVGGKFTSFNGITAGNITRIFGDSGVQARNSSTEFFSEPEIDTNLDSRIVIYPNPSKDIFHLDLSQEEASFNSISIFNLLGVRVHYQSITSKELNYINLSQFADGYYIGILEGDDKNISIKLIKN